MENLIAKYKAKLPDSYLSFIARNERFTDYLGEEFGYVDIWDFDILNETFDLACENHDNLGKDYFPIGSDGGGETICIDLASGTGKLFFIEAISISDENAVYFCDSFDKLYNAIKQHLLK